MAFSANVWNSFVTKRKNLTVNSFCDWRLKFVNFYALWINLLAVWRPTVQFIETIFTFLRSWVESEEIFTSFFSAVFLLHRHILCSIISEILVFPTLVTSYHNFTQCRYFFLGAYNPFNRKRDQHLISPYNNIAKSYIKVMRMQRMIASYTNFSSWVPKDRVKYGEDGYWC